MIMIIIVDKFGIDLYNKIYQSKTLGIKYSLEENNYG